MDNWTIASHFLVKLRRQTGERRQLACTPETLVDWYTTAFPTEAGSQDARLRVRQLLDTLVDVDAIVLPKGKDGWLPFPPPKLPAWIKFPVEKRKPRDQRHRNFPWGPELAFLSNLPSVPHLETLFAINEWLRGGGRQTTLVIPLRERSIEITGDEKTLDACIRCRTLQSTPGEGVTLELLKAHLAPPPLSYEPGPAGITGRPVLVVENAHTWHSFATWNRRVGRYAAVVYGSGTAFVASVSDLRRVIDTTGAADEVRYFGDLDFPGLAIPCEAGEVAVDAGVPVPLPEEWLYEKLLESPTQASDAKYEDTDGQTLIGWLPGCLQEKTRELLCAGYRIAQERVGTSFLMGVR